MPINKNEITKEMIEKAMQCKTADELIELAKTGGYELTKEEAETYLAELADYELDSSEMKNIAGGKCYMRTDLDDWFCPDRKRLLHLLIRTGIHIWKYIHVIWLSRGDKRWSGGSVYGYENTNFAQ